MVTMKVCFSNSLQDSHSLREGLVASPSYTFAYILCLYSFYIFHFASEDLTGRQQRSTDHFNRIFADHEKQKLQLESQMKELEIRELELAKREAENETQRKIVAEELEQVYANVLIY